MIKALLDYSHDRGLVSAPGYAKKQIRWVLGFNESATEFTGLVSSDQEFSAAPDLSQPELKTLGARHEQAAHFLIAPLGTFLGWSREEADLPKEQARRRTLAWMLEQAGQGQETLRNLGRAMLADDFRDTCLQRIESMKPKPKPTDLVTVRIGDTFPVNETFWHEWWDAFRQSLKKGQAGRGDMACFGTGELVQPEPTHPKLRKLSGVGLSQPHAPLITFDKPAFESYGLDQARNAAMSAGTATAYVDAVDHLIENSVLFGWRRQKPGKPKELARDFARLGGARIAYWYTGSEDRRREVESENDLIGMLIGGPRTLDQPPEDDEQERILAEARLHQAIERIRAGGIVLPVQNIRFCVLALSGAGGRVMVRDFVQGSVLQLANAADAWFQDLSFVTWSGRPGRSPSLERVLTAPLATRKPDQEYLKWVSPCGAWRQALWRAALLEGRIPETAAGRALDAHNKTVVRGDLFDEDAAPVAQSRSRLQLALVKAHLIRKGVQMTPALDPEHPSPAYHCGRLLAEFDSLQRAALGDVGAGVIQRFYGGALTNPSGVFAQLSRLAMTHLAKLGGGLAVDYGRRIAEIHNGIRGGLGEAPAYPVALGPEDQALFALGFWHQTAKTNKDIIERSAAKKAAQSDPATSKKGDDES